MTTPIHLIHVDDDESPFPDPSNALVEPDGLLAVGGNLSPTRLLIAYRQGVFPWFSEGDPILWWSPNPRTVFIPEQIHVNRSLRKAIRKQPYRLTLDTAFEQVMRACAEPREQQDGTWITESIIDAYVGLHKRGFAHSVEAWQDDQLVGGLYGVSLGRCFFGESMFSRKDNASKIVFAHFVAQLKVWGFGLIDGQVHSDHLTTLGSQEIDRPIFLSLLDDLCDLIPDVPNGHKTQWQFDDPLPDPIPPP